jgi:hypothetical protein
LCRGAFKTSRFIVALQVNKFCRGILGYLQEILKEEEIDGQDLVEGISEKNTPIVRSTRVTRRLRPHEEVKLGRIVSRRIIVGLSSSIRSARSCTGVKS